MNRLINLRANARPICLLKVILLRQDLSVQGSLTMLSMNFFLISRLRRWVHFFRRDFLMSIVICPNVFNLGRVVMNNRNYLVLSNNRRVANVCGRGMLPCLQGRLHFGLTCLYRAVTNNLRIALRWLTKDVKSIARNRLRQEGPIFQVRIRAYGVAQNTICVPCTRIVVCRFRR